MTLGLAIAGCRDGCARQDERSVDADAGAGGDVGANLAVDLEAFRLRANVPALVAVAVTRDDVALAQAAGLADVEGRVAATPDTTFASASLAKLIVAVTAMQSVERGAFSLDDDVTSLVGFPVEHPSHPRVLVTPRMLLAHTSSIRDVWTVIDVERDEADDERGLGPFLASYLARGNKERWHAERPGAAMHYSNVGAALAALAVERTDRRRRADAGTAAGPPRTFARIATEDVLAPLGMTTAAWSRRDARSPAIPYAARGAGFVRVPARDRDVYPASGLHASARDLARFARAVLGEGELDGVRVIDRASARRLVDHAAPVGFVPVLATGGEGRSALLGHEGEDAGASTALVVDVTRHVGAIVLANGDAFASNDPSRAEALKELLVRLLDAAHGAGATKYEQRR